MILHLIDWIWHVRGAVPLPPGQSDDQAFERLDPLFRAAGTTRERTGDTLTFTKKDQAAQDKMAIFDSGVLRIENDVRGPVLRYSLASRALLFCFLAPLLFLALAQVNTVLMRSPAENTKSAKAASKKPAAKQPLPQSAIDKFLGAPAPEKPKKDDKADPDGGKPSATPAYVFAGIFAFLYVFGRILEDRLIKALFRKRLTDLPS